MSDSLNDVTPEQSIEHEPINQQVAKNFEYLRMASAMVIVKRKVLCDLERENHVYVRCLIRVSFLELTQVRSTSLETGWNKRLLKFICSSSCWWKSFSRPISVKCELLTSCPLAMIYIEKSIVNCKVNNFSSPRPESFHNAHTNLAQLSFVQLFVRISISETRE